MTESAALYRGETLSKVRKHWRYDNQLRKNKNQFYSYEEQLRKIARIQCQLFLMAEKTSSTSIHNIRSSAALTGTGRIFQLSSSVQLAC